MHLKKCVTARLPSSPIFYKVHRRHFLMHFFVDQNRFFLKKIYFYGIKLILTTEHGISHDKRKNQPKYICWGCHDDQNGSFIYLDINCDITLEGFQLFYFLIFFHTNMISSSFEQKTNQTHISWEGRGGRGYSDVISPWNHLVPRTKELISERICLFFSHSKRAYTRTYIDSQIFPIFSGSDF